MEKMVHLTEEILQRLNEILQLRTEILQVGKENQRLHTNLIIKQGERATPGPTYLQFVCINEATHRSVGNS